MINPSTNQPRDSDGRFGHKPAAEVDLSLGAGYSHDEEPLPDSVQVITAEPGELDQYVYHGSWEVRADATANPHLTDEHVAELCRPDQPIGVRAGMSLNRRPGVAAYLANDPSATVRSQVSEHWEFTDDDRCRLLGDPVVARIHRLLGAPAQ